MTSKEKAEELVEKFKEEAYRGMVFTSDLNLEREKRHLEKGVALALIAIEEIIKVLKETSVPYYLGEYKSFWQDVKGELLCYRSNHT